MALIRNLATLLLAAALVGCSGGDGGATAVSTERQTAEALQFSLPDLDGTPRNLGEWSGRVVLLNFWAPWCPPCRKEIPALMELQAKYGERGLTVVGVAVDTHQNTQDYADSMAIDYPILVGEEQGIELAGAFGNHLGALPYSVVLDRGGKVQTSHRGEISLEQAEQAVVPHL